jgi:hypothetical protein
LESREHQQGNYVAAFRDTILPALKSAIDEGKITRPASRRPLLLQDDNAKPHRGPFGGKESVTEYICEMANKMGICMRPKSPGQPAQSPDLNPLDTFLFRAVSSSFRRARAQDFVKRIAAKTARSRANEEEEEQRSGVAVRVGGLQFEENEDEHEGAKFVQQTVPLRCKPEKTRKAALCGGCSKAVRDSDHTAIQCELRFGWWHLHCVEQLVGTELYPNAEMPELDSNKVWVCPQCAMHLCQNDDRTRHLCLVCWEPSHRSGEENMGTDMISCDGRFGGLFHRRCVNYDDAEMAASADFWLCAACECVGG